MAKRGNWALAWRERGLMGMLSGHVGGAPRKLTAPLLQTAVQIACDESLTLAKIAQRDGIEMPITQMIAALMAQEITLRQAIQALMSRPLKEE